MNSSEKIEKIVGYKFKNKKLLTLAFTHSSYANEKRAQSNERLEFLGDSVLELLCTEALYDCFDVSEGELTKYRASLVNEQTLAFVIDELELGGCLLRGKGESKTPVTLAEKCDLYEAIIGAIYLDGGYVAAKKFFDKTHKDAIEKLKTGFVSDAKTQLQEMLSHEQIKYVTTKSGEDHNPTYKSSAVINGVKMGSGEAHSKRTAEQIAAKNTINMIKKA